MQVTIESSRAFERRLGELTSLVGEMRDRDGAVLLPTRVTEYLREQRGGAALYDALPGAQRRALGEEYSRQVVRAALGPRAGRRERQARAWRFWCYRYVERMWSAVQHQAWGRVAESTYERKRLPERKGGSSSNVPARSWGIRHSRPAWYRVQKRQVSSGRYDTRGHLTETRPLLAIYLGGRIVALK